MKFDDAIWNVIAETMEEYKGIYPDEKVRQIVEENVIITPFKGGVFVSRGNEFDLFVVPEMRGKWNVKKEIDSFIKTMFEHYDKIVVRISKRNQKSMRLAKFWGFQETDSHNGIVKLELRKWKL